MVDSLIRVVDGIETGESQQVLFGGELVVDADAMADDADPGSNIRLAGVAVQDAHLAFGGLGEAGKDAE